MNQNLQDILSKLAEKLGTSVETLWPTLVRYEATQAIVGLVVILLLLAASVVGFIRFFRSASEPKRSYCDNKEGAIVLTIICAFVIVVLAICMVETIPNVLYPEAEAFHNLLGSLR